MSLPHEKKQHEKAFTTTGLMIFFRRDDFQRDFSFAGMTTFPEINIAFANGPGPKGNSHLNQPLIFRGDVAVSFRDG